MKSLTFFLLAALFIISSAQTCTDPNCVLCGVANATSTNCTACNTGFFLAFGQGANSALATCQTPANFNCNGNSYANYTGCTSCPSTQGFSANFSSTTAQACATCTVSGCGNCASNFATCAYCQTGSIFQTVANNVCTTASSLGCTTATAVNYTGCSSCPTANTGLEINFAGGPLTGCASCISNCANCALNALTCAVCQSGFIFPDMTNTACYNASLLDCETSANYTGCLTCPNATMGLLANASGNLAGCATCSVGGCGNCASNALTCAYCLPNFIFPNNMNATCTNITNLNCSKSANITGCSSCSVGSGLNFATASPLVACTTCNDTNCNTCSANYTYCSQCDTGFIAYNAFNSSVNSNVSICANASSLNCNSTNDTINWEGCEACAVGLYLNQTVSPISLTVCSECSSICASCSNSTNCLACPSGQTLTGYKNGNTCATASAQRMVMGVVSMILMAFYML